MSQWGQGQQGYQYPMQTGFPAGNPQFQQNPQFQPQNPQFQQPNQQFQQQGGLGIPNGGGLLPQQTGFPGQRPQGFQQPQQTGFPGGSGFIQQQATGFPGNNFQQQARPAPPPVPPMPSQFQQPNQPSFLSMPPQQPNRLLSASPGFGGGGLLPQQTGFGGRPGGGGGMLVPQVTGFVDPRLQMMTQTFMPMNTSAPYNAAGAPQLQPQQQNLVQSFQQHNQAQRGSTNQQMSWALTKVEKKNYDNIFRQWVQGAQFMSGPTAIEVFGACDLPKDDLARIWTLADINDRGKLNLAEFHVAMGLIYRRLNGMQVPDVLPPELVPPSHRDLDDSVDRVKDLLRQETRAHSPSSVDSPISYLKNRSFNGNSPSLDSNRDATIYKHSDAEPSGIYKPRSRHIDRDAVRSRNDDDDPSADLSDMKRQLANRAQMLDRNAEADSQRTREDEELDREMDDLKYRVKRVQEDLDYVSRGPKTASKEEERRRLEREMLSLMHERIPEVERKIKARDERKEKEKRQWARDRDRANDRFGRYDNRDEYSSRDDRERPYSRGDDRNRPYSRGDDRPYSRGDYSRTDDRDRPYSRGAVDRDDREEYRRERSQSRERSYNRPRSPPTSRAAPAPPAAEPATSIRNPPPAPVPPQSAPSPSIASMTPEQRKNYLQEQAKLRIQARMAALGVTQSGSSPTLDTSVEDRLQQEKKEAEEKSKAAERQAEERERARKERLDNEKALKEGRNTPAPPPAAPPPVATSKPVITPKSAPAPTPKVAPPPPKPRSAAPPPPKSRSSVPRPAFSAAATPPAPVVPVAPPTPEVDPEEEKFRAREEAIKKAREERERKLRELEEQEAAARQEEERYQARVQALKAKAAKSPSPPPAPPVQATPPPPSPPPAPPMPPVPRSAPALSPAAEKSTNPFSRLLKEGGAATPPATPPAATNGSTNPWARSQTASPSSVPQPSKSPAPSSAKTTYQTAPSSVDDDWDDIKEKEDDDDSSDDEITQSRSVRANIAQQLFGNILPRPTSAAASSPSSTSPSSPAPSGAAPPPPVAPAPPPAPPAPVAAASTPAAPSDVGALMRSIQGGARLRPTKTVDKSAPPVSGKVLGDTAPPAHINATPRPISPPAARAPSPPAPVHVSIPETPSMTSNDDASRSSNRQSVGWFADRAADIGGSPVIVERLPSMVEDEEEDIYQTPPSIPEIMVHESLVEPTSDLMADIDKSIQHRTRSLYAFEGDGPDDLSFGENLMIVANPSKTGGDWWYGKMVNSGKSGLFPKTYVDVVTLKKAKAVYTYTGSNPDELPFTEGDTLSIIDTSEEEWWKAEQGGVVFIVPAAYLELVEEVQRSGGITVDNKKPSADASANANANPKTSISSSNNTRTPISKNEALDSTDLSLTNAEVDDDEDDDTDDDSDSDSDYQSFDEADNDENSASSRLARERERQLVLEAAGLIVQQDVGSPPLRPKSKSIKRRPAPAAPRRTVSIHKDLPPVPLEPETEAIEEPEPEPELSHEARLDDAFARYESFRNTQSNLNRLSVVSTDSTMTAATSASSPTATTPTATSLSLPGHQGQSQNGKSETEGRYSHFLNFLTGSKAPEVEHRQRRSASTLNISAPIMANSSSQDLSQGQTQESPSRSNSPSFGMSWASLVNKAALEGIPPGERKRQEAIFELINTEIAYVRDLQLIVEAFYSSMLPLLTTKEITVVFANIEDLLLTNTGFVSELEERQKDCRLYIDKIGDILLTQLPNMGVYMEYCVNQSTAIKVLQSLRESKPDLASHLQHLRDENPSIRNLDLSSYLLAPMQRITRYPLLFKQILQYTEAGDEQEAIEKARDISERLLGHINETIREQEGHETLKKISQNLWIGQGRLDLTAPTRHMGPRRLLKQGVLMKAKSGKKLNAFLCSDILVLTDDSVKNLYRMPIPLAHAQVKDSGSKDDTGFQISQPYPRGGDSVSLRALSPRDCQQWIQEIGYATRKARHAEERTARKNGRR